MLHLLVYSVAAKITFSALEDESGGWGPTPGAFDVKYNGQSLSRDNLGTFAQIEINGNKYDIGFDSVKTEDGIRIDLTSSNSPSNPDIGFLKLNLQNTGSNVKNVRVVFKSDITIGDDENSATKLSDNVYYFDDATANIPKYVFDISSTRDYTGPSKFSYDVIDNNAEVEKYYDRNDRPDTISGDLYVSYAWDMREMSASSSVTYGIKMQFANIPVLSVTDPDETVFQNGDSIGFTNVRVTKSESGKLTWMINDEIKGSSDYQSFSMAISVTVNNDMHYSVEPKIFKIYAEDGGFRSNVYSFSFMVKNTPVLESAKFKQTSAYPGNKIQLSVNVNDKDNGKTLHVFAKAANKDAVIVKTFQSNGNSQTIEDFFTVPDLGESGQKDVKVWVSDNSTSTEDSNDGRYAKSEIKTAQFELLALPKLDITYPTKTTYQHGEKIHLTGKINSKGITMKFKIDTEALKETRSFKIDDFNFDLDIPETTKFGEHTLHVIIIDSNNYEAIDDAKFKFTYSNTAPVFKDVKLEQETVTAGSKTKIVGEVKDVDVGSSIIITASYGENKQKQTTVKSDGNFQKFEIEIETDDSMKDKTIEIEVKATDNIAFTIDDPNLKLKVTSNSVGAQTSGKLTPKQKVIIGVIVPIVLLAVAGAVGYFMYKKKNSGDNDDGYVKESTEV